MSSDPAPEYTDYVYTNTGTGADRTPNTDSNTSSPLSHSTPWIDEKPKATLSDHSTSTRQGTPNTSLDRQRIHSITKDLDSLKHEAVAKLQSIRAQEKSDLTTIQQAKSAYSKGRKDLAYIKAHAKSRSKNIKHRRWAWERIKSVFGDENAGFGSFWRGRERKVEGGYMKVREEVVEEYMVRRRPIIARLPVTGEEYVDVWGEEEQEVLGVDEVLERVCGRDLGSESRVLRMRARKDQVMA